jgi:hypothetical protein
MTGLKGAEKALKYIEDIPKNFHRLYAAKKNSEREAEKDFIL